MEFHRTVMVEVYPTIATGMLAHDAGSMRLSRRNLVLTTVPLFAARKKGLEWRKGRLSVVRHRVESGAEWVPMAEATMQTSVSRFEVEGGSAAYLLQETVARAQRLEFDGDLDISFAVDGKKVLVRLPNGKHRTMELLETYQLKGTPQNDDRR